MRNTCTSIHVNSSLSSFQMAIHSLHDEYAIMQNLDFLRRRIVKMSLPLPPLVTPIKVAFLMKLKAQNTENCENGKGIR